MGRKHKRRRKGDKVQQLFPNRPWIVAYEFDLGIDFGEIIAAAIEQEEERVRERRRQFKVIRDPGDEKGPP